jgi:hypothetical protein
MACLPHFCFWGVDRCFYDTKEDRRCGAFHNYILIGSPFQVNRRMKYNAWKNDVLQRRIYDTASRKQAPPDQRQGRLIPRKKGFSVLLREMPLSLAVLFIFYVTSSLVTF